MLFRSVEQLFKILGISKYRFVKKNDGIEGANVVLEGKTIGQIEVENVVTFELDLTEALKHTTSKKIYVEPAKFPPIIEDVRVEIAPHYTFHEIESEIKKVSALVYDVALLDVYENKKTFRITFLDRKRNLSNEDILPIRNDIYKTLESEFKAIVG